MLEGNAICKGRLALTNVDNFDFVLLRRINQNGITLGFTNDGLRQGGLVGNLVLKRIGFKGRDDAIRLHTAAR